MNVLYTSLLYRNKKIKSWSDGTLVVKGAKSELYDSLGNLIDVSWKTVKDSILIMEKYLVQQNEEISESISKKRKFKLSNVQLKFTKSLHTRVNTSETNVTLPLSDNCLDSQPVAKSPESKPVHKHAPRQSRKPQTCFKAWVEEDSDASKTSQEDLQDKNKLQSPDNLKENIHIISHAVKETEQSKEKEFTSLFFPGLDKIQNANSSRSIVIPHRFRDAKEYIEFFTRAINENLQIQISNIASNYYQKLKNCKEKDLGKLEIYFRNNGIAFYGLMDLRLFIMNNILVVTRNEKKKVILCN